jgi:4-amino-4-deoxy-L-arabinose transferase-like glycosyltransferase
MRILGVILLIGTGIRIWLIAHAAPPHYAIDGLFDTLGWNLATGHGFTLDGETPAAHYGPAYPGILALLYYCAGHRPDLVPYAHILFDLLAGVCVYFGARLLFGPRVAAWAAAVLYLYPAYWTYDLRIRSESLLTMLMAAWLWAAVCCAKFGRVRMYALSGLLAGLAILCKPVVIPAALLLAVLPAITSPTGRAVVPRLALYVGCMLLVVLPWTVRNAFAFGAFLPVSTGMGVGLWTGSDPVSEGSYPMSPETEAQLWETAGIAPLAYPHVMYEVSVDRDLRTKGWARIRAHPGRYIRLTFTRVFHFWIGNRLYLANSELGFADGIRRDVTERGGIVATYSLAKRLLLIPVALLLAAWAGWRLRTRWRELFPLYALPVGLTLGYVPFMVESGRYALPVLPCVFILAVAAVTLRGKATQVRSS